MPNFPWIPDSKLSNSRKKTIMSTWHSTVPIYPKRCHPKLELKALEESRWIGRKDAAAHGELRKAVKTVKEAMK
jgi:hypothetical protein